MKRLLACVALSVSVACASGSGPRHLATVSVVTAHSTLAAAQDTEMLLVCDRQGAPAAPACIPVDKHKEIAGLFAQAFEYDGQVARLVRALPVGQPQPAEVGELLGRIGELVNRIIAALPKTAPQTRALVENLKGASN